MEICYRDAPFMSRYSRISPSFDYDEQTWVVSIINTETWDITGGHSAIVVEGLEDNSLSIYEKKVFIGQYDIGASAEVQSCINTEGIIHNIRCYENEKNTRNYEELKFPARSYCVLGTMLKK